MASDKTSYSLQCASSNSRTAVIKAPEGMKITCSERKSTVSVGTECEVECETGGPNHALVSCKSAGWRPTNELECDGVNPGVIVGVLIAGIIAVVVCAFVYAKYRQHKKKKSGRDFKVQKGKLNQSSNRNRPGKSIGPPTTEDKPKQVSYTSSDSTRTKSSSRKSKPPSYNDVEGGDGSNETKPKPGSVEQAAPEIPSHDDEPRRGQHHRKQRGTHQQHGYSDGYHGYQHADPHSTQQIGYSNHAYYPQGQVGYSYTNQEPAVGYQAMAHPQAYPAGRDYHRAYNVPT